MLDLLNEQKTQGPTQFEWIVVKAVLKNDMLKKLKSWEWFIGGTCVGVDYNIRVVKVINDAWDRFLQVHYVIILHVKTY